MKLIFGLLLLSVTLTAFAQDNSRVTLRDGSTTVLINRSENDNDTNRRIRNLEQAVRDLQEQVYDLRGNERTRTVVFRICSIKTIKGTFVGRGPTKLDAQVVARNSCKKAGVSSCDDARINPISCELAKEEVAY